eukprot:EG_transcript_28060
MATYNLTLPLGPPPPADGAASAPPVADVDIPVCLDFLKGRCTRAQCRFTHPDLRRYEQLSGALHATSGRHVCEVWAMTGTCKFGAKCSRLHPVSVNPQPQPMMTVLLPVAVVPQPVLVTPPDVLAAPPQSQESVTSRPPLTASSPSPHSTPGMFSDPTVMGSPPLSPLTTPPLTSFVYRNPQPATSPQQFRAPQSQLRIPSVAALPLGGYPLPALPPAP